MDAIRKITRFERNQRLKVAKQVKSWLAMQVIPTPWIYARAREVIAANVPGSASQARLASGRRSPTNRIKRSEP